MQSQHILLFLMSLGHTKHDLRHTLLVLKVGENGNEPEIKKKYLFPFQKKTALIILKNTKCFSNTIKINILRLMKISLNSLKEKPEKYKVIFPVVGGICASAVPY